jgi:hypothetical protein
MPKTLPRKALISISSFSGAIYAGGLKTGLFYTEALGPDHDWSSHAADAFGYMAIAYEEPPANSRRIRRPPPPRIGTHWSD